MTRAQCSRARGAPALNRSACARELLVQLGEPTVAYTISHEVNSANS